MYMLGQMLRTVNRTMLSAGASKAEHQRREAAFYIPLDVFVGQSVHALQEFQYLAIVLEEAYHWLVQSRQLLVRLITAWVVCASTVKNISSTVACRVLGNTFLI